MIARPVRALSSLVAVLLAAACTNSFEIPIETPIRPKLDVAAFQRVLVAGFIAGGTEDVDGNLETTRLLRSQLRTKSQLRVIDSDVLPLVDVATEGRDSGGAATTPPPIKEEKDLEAYIRKHRAARYNGTEAPRLAFVSPIAHERLARLVHVDVDARNRELERYTEAMRRVTGRLGVPFADVFTPMREAMASAKAPLTVNGMHLNEEGDKVFAVVLLTALGLAPDELPAGSKSYADLRALINEKNRLFFLRWRPLNAEYVVGRRVEPFGSVNFPPEMKRLDELIESAGGGYILRTSEPERARALLLAHGVEGPVLADGELRFQAEPEAIEALSIALGQASIGIAALTPRHATLEELFIKNVFCVLDKRA